MDTRYWSRFVILLAGVWITTVFGQDIVEPIQPLQKLQELNPMVVALGRRLFQDPRLSRDSSLSCAHCHHLNLGGSDNLPVSIGVGGKKGVINAPTVYNLNTHIAYFSDGRAATLENLVDGPLRNPLEMAADWPEVVSKLKDDPSIVLEFDRLFPHEEICKQTISKAIATFLRSLVTTDSPMDRWLAGDKTALSEKQLRGYKLFKSYGCVACHQGQAVGGNMYATMGAINNYFEEREAPVNSVDRGRYNITGNKNDMYVFKVPSLRLVVTTAPYFHDASADTLEKAITVMARYQLGREISAGDVSDIKAFLGSLLGKHPLLTVQK
jgi:cytochrome c peroxidase